MRRAGYHHFAQKMRDQAGIARGMYGVDIPVRGLIFLSRGEKHVLFLVRVIVGLMPKMA